MDTVIGGLTLIVGSFLGFVATLVSSNISSNKSERAKRQSHSQYLRLELAETLKSLEQIRTAYEHQHFYDFLLLDLLDRNVDNLQDARRQTYLIDDEKLQGRIFMVVNRVSVLAKEMRSIQQHAYSKNTTTDTTTGEDRAMTAQEREGKENLIRETRQSNLMEILDLKRETESLIDRLQS